MPPALAQCGSGAANGRCHRTAESVRDRRLNVPAEERSAVKPVVSSEDAFRTSKIKYTHLRRSSWTLLFGSRLTPPLADQFCKLRTTQSMSLRHQNYVDRWSAAMTLLTLM
ncbi:hypothetical protein EVAR_29392_1 [Eumeta japonica]|uniref:Uncharacterized protein n=1 Tax=Eumeta variegata TaxID=151549 RepID=A0A4C1ZV08_EUMVA|nr:hypothetical protein EVAR_29392_1 [Eumeta japonica]